MLCVRYKISHILLHLVVPRCLLELLNPFLEVIRKGFNILLPLLGIQLKEQNGQIGRDALAKKKLQVLFSTTL